MHGYSVARITLSVSKCIVTRLVDFSWYGNDFEHRDSLGSFEFTLLLILIDPWLRNPANSVGGCFLPHRPPTLRISDLNQASSTPARAQYCDLVNTLHGPNTTFGTTMAEEKQIHQSVSPHLVRNDGNEHIEALAHERNSDDPSYVDHRADDDRADEAKGRNSDRFEKKYWLSVNYIGTMFAIGMAFMGGIGGMFDASLLTASAQKLTFNTGYGLIAPVLEEINKDIGPSPNINWIPLVNLCGGAVFFLMVGQLSDIFGRRW